MKTDRGMGTRESGPKGRERKSLGEMMGGDPPYAGFALPGRSSLQTL